MADKSFDIEIRQIEPGDKLSGLSLGDAKFQPLKTFFQKHAKRFHEQNYGRTYGVFTVSDKPKIVAYLTLVCGEVYVEDGVERPIEDPNYVYSQFPAIKIARLAVDKSARKIKIGRKLVELSMGIAKDTICPAVGCRFVMVDAK